MRRTVVNVLAVIGALALLSAISAFIPRWAYRGITGRVMGPGDEPAAGAPVFLDRGDGVIERFLTDSAGRFSLPVAFHQVERASVLICVPGGAPHVAARNRHMIGPARFNYTPQSTDRAWPARRFGWRGPIPRECHADSAYYWRLPPGASAEPMAVSTSEPDWGRDAPPK